VVYCSVFWSPHDAPPSARVWACDGVKERTSFTRNLSPDTLRGRGWTVPGSLVRRGRSFALKLYAGQEDGKKKQKWITFPSRAEAEAAQRELASHTLAHAAGTGLYGSPRERLGPYLRDWCKRQRGRLAPKTARWYDMIAEQIERDPLGTIPLARLTPRALEAYYGRRLAQGLSSTTVLHHHQMLHAALRAAERQDMILKNPAAIAEAPRRARVTLQVWSESETALFLSDARGRSPYFSVYLFLVGTGCRIGEALGIEWRDVDLAEGLITIRQALQRPEGGGYVLREPKTKHSRRAITLPIEVVDELRRVRAGQEAAAITQGRCPDGARCQRVKCERWHALDLVFCLPNGRPLHDNNIRQRDLYPRCKRLGLPWRRALHNLRHAHATHLLQRGVSVKVVQERLGHGAAAFTLSAYGHVLAGMQAGAAQAVSAMLQGCYSPATPSGGGRRAETPDKSGGTDDEQ
jgi:integrase